MKILYIADDGQEFDNKQNMELYNYIRSMVSKNISKGFILYLVLKMTENRLEFIRLIANSELEKEQ